MLVEHLAIFQYGAFFEKDEKVKAEKMKKVGEETIPNNLVWGDHGSTYICAYLLIFRPTW